MLNQNDLVSIVIPCRNASAYIEESINSLLFQTYSNIEIIVIDDGSSDGTCEIVADLMSTDKRIRYYYTDPKGISSALNFGISLADGVWIARMDADDVSIKNRIERQIDFALSNNANIVGSWVELFDKSRTIGIRKYPLSSGSIRLQTAFNSPFAHPSLLIKKWILELYPYNADFDSIEDYELWSRVLMDPRIRPVNIQYPLVRYRKSYSQTSTSKRAVLSKLHVEIACHYFYSTNAYLLIEDLFHFFHAARALSLSAPVHSFHPPIRKVIQTLDAYIVFGQSSPEDRSLILANLYKAFLFLTPCDAAIFFLKKLLQFYGPKKYILILISSFVPTRIKLFLSALFLFYS